MQKQQVFPIPSPHLTILLLWPLASGESTKLCLEWLTFQPVLQTSFFLSLPTESVIKLPHKKMQIPIPSNTACKGAAAHSPKVLLDTRSEFGFNLQTPRSMFNQNISVYARQQPLAPVGFCSQHLPRKDKDSSLINSALNFTCPGIQFYGRSVGSSKHFDCCPVQSHEILLLGRVSCIPSSPAQHSRRDQM